MIYNKLFPKLSSDEVKDLNRLCRRECMWSMCWEQITGQAKGLVYAYYPFLEEIYKDDQEELVAAYERQFKYFNTNPNLGGFIVGLVYAMEKKRGLDRNAVTAKSITDVRVALCGPFAGIGDSIIQSVLKVIIAGLTMTLAQNGNILGPILFVAIFGSLQRFIMSYLTFLGYSSGTNTIDKLFAGGIINTVTNAISVLGLVMTGALTASTVSFKLKWMIELGGTTVDVQGILDSILPGFFALALTFMVSSLLKKKAKIAYVVYAIIIVCVILGYFKIV